MIEREARRARDGDVVSLQHGWAGVAETGTQVDGALGRVAGAGRSGGAVARQLLLEGRPLVGMQQRAGEAVGPGGKIRPVDPAVPMGQRKVVWSERGADRIGHQKQLQAHTALLIEGDGQPQGVKQGFAAVGGAVGNHHNLLIHKRLLILKGIIVEPIR